MAVRRPGRWLALAATMAIVFSSSVALLSIDSPQTLRDRRLDRERLADLDSLADAIDCHWWRHGLRVPETLAALKPDTVAPGSPAARRLAPSCYTTALNDPQTGEPYGYKALGAAEFELCARFARAGAPSGAGSRAIAWRRIPAAEMHGAGAQCFRLTARRPRWLSDRE